MTEYKIPTMSTAAVLAQVVKAIAEDREGKIRQALISLGWTPPK
jgi:hypothetical protein